MSALVILGGGPAGLAVAFYAHRGGIPAVLYEKSVALGGLCQTFRWAGHCYDAGAHRFHDRDPEITGDVRALLGDRLIAVNAPSKIYDRGRFIDFPPTPINLIVSSGVGQLGRIGIELMRRKNRGAVRGSFADAAISRFGKTLARRYLLTYSEKVWGLPADELSADVATRRLNGMTMKSLLVELVTPSRKTAHIDGEFLYPRGGYGEIAAALASQVPAAALRREHEVTRVECEAQRVKRIHFVGRAPVPVGGRVAAALPLSLLVRCLGDALPTSARQAAAQLRFRSIRLLWVRLAQASVSPNASIYLPDPELCVSRVSEPKNRSRAMAPPDETALVAEVPCFIGDDVQRLGDDDLARRVIDELGHIGLVSPAKVVEWRHHFLPFAYPVYALDYSDRVRLILEAVGSIENLDVLGRGGRFHYSHLHDQMRTAKRYVEQLNRERTTFTGGTDVLVDDQEPA